MKLTVQVKLLPTGEQSASLKTTMETANAAADRLSELAWSEVFGKVQYRILIFSPLFFVHMLYDGSIAKM